MNAELNRASHLNTHEAFPAKNHTILNDKHTVVLCQKYQGFWSNLEFSVLKQTQEIY